jgi:hypothetical protein
VLTVAKKSPRNQNRGRLAGRQMAFRMGTLASCGEQAHKARAKSDPCVSLTVPHAMIWDLNEFHVENR